MRVPPIAAADVGTITNHMTFLLAVATFNHLLTIVYEMSTLTTAFTLKTVAFIN